MLTENQNLSIQEALKSDSQRRAFFAQMKKGGKGATSTFLGGNIRPGSPFSDKPFAESPTRRILLKATSTTINKRGSAFRASIAKAIKQARKDIKHKRTTGQVLSNFSKVPLQGKGKDISGRSVVVRMSGKTRGTASIIQDR